MIYGYRQQAANFNRYPIPQKHMRHLIMQSQITQSQAQSDFQPLPNYTQTIRSNAAWVIGTLTKEYPDGSIAQVSTIVSKR